jgi:hypothetical protein
VAGATLIGLAEAAASPDAQLIAWEAEVQKREAALDQAKTITDEEINKACEPLNALEHRIAGTEARTVRGLAVKFRRFLKDREEGEGAWTDDNVRTMLASFERLAGGERS